LHLPWQEKAKDPAPDNLKTANWPSSEDPKELYDAYDDPRDHIPGRDLGHCQ
jgi:hypothetical protein